MSKGLKTLYILAIPLLLAVEFTVVLTSSSLLFELVGTFAVFFLIFVDIVYLSTRKKMDN
jgi:hypothetical protein